MKANLHLHSRFSDGSLFPWQIAQSAALLGIEAAALTDHDTMGGSEAFVEECGRLGLTGVTGCEMDVVEPSIDYRSELLGYFPGRAARDCWSTNVLLSQAQRERKKRIEYYLYWAQVIFKRPDLTYDDLLRARIVRGYGVYENGAVHANAARVDAEAGPDVDMDVDDPSQDPQKDPKRYDGLSWSKVDLFLYLRSKGLVPQSETYRKFKKEWFVPGRFPKYRLAKPRVEDVVSAVHKDDGFVVVPHFGHLWNDEIDDMKRDIAHFDALLSYFRRSGVDGIELYWYTSAGKTEAINSFVLAQAAPLGFFFTYGSDCHGPGTDKCTIDKFSGDFNGFGIRS
ncbi:MAG TPA: PHP domain-containing protein [Spirochaetales bacterium]|nr:PHP domain-containing protein [Spirochaetales bacterium]